SMNMLIFQNLDINISGVVNGEVITVGVLLGEIVEDCLPRSEIYLDLYISDVFKPNPSLRANRIFRYKMSRRVKQESLGVTVKKQFVEQLYTVERVDDIHSFRSFSQIIP
ncbi:MAG: hypothetical protein MJ102_09960, partial [Clostridia bacterium]|nr:hypothetical protein [Clostridia bacterium]